MNFPDLKKLDFKKLKSKLIFAWRFDLSVKKMEAWNSVCFSELCTLRPKRSDAKWKLGFLHCCSIDFRLTIKRSQRLLVSPLLRRLLNLEDTMEFGLKKAKLFLVFVAICATTTATPIPTTNANGASMSAFLTNLKQGLENLKQGLENLLGLVQRFEMEQSTQIDQTTTTTESTMANDQSSK